MFIRSELSQQILHCERDARDTIDRFNRFLSPFYTILDTLTRRYEESKIKITNKPHGPVAEVNIGWATLVVMPVPIVALRPAGFPFSGDERCARILFLLKTHTFEQYLPVSQMCIFASDTWEAAGPGDLQMTGKYSDEDVQGYLLQLLAAVASAAPHTALEDLEFEEVETEEADESEFTILNPLCLRPSNSSE